MTLCFIKYVNSIYNTKTIKPIIFNKKFNFKIEIHFKKLQNKNIVV